MPAEPNISGLRFGRLTAIRRVGSANYKSIWLFRCDCGAFRQAFAYNVRNGNTSSCGCLAIERQQASNFKHGLVGTSEYLTWSAMKRRCADPANNRYDSYGGRGIRVCPRWLNSFQAFLDDMGPRPTPAHSIERKDNDGDYTPSNCHWATDIDQANNRRNNRFIVAFGQRMTLTQWARKIGRCGSWIRRRLERGDLPEAFLQP